MTQILELAGVTKAFEAVVAVSDASLTVHSGETLAVIGPNGSGKSTLFGVIAGEYYATSGRVELLGRDVTKRPASRLTRAGVSRTFQVARLFGSRTVRENVLLASGAGRGVSLRFWDRFGSHALDVDRTDAVIARLQMEDLAGAPARSLPQGERKWLELAMALVQEPDLLLLDEPTAGMALDDIRRTIDLIRTVRDDRPDLAIIITAHDMEVVFELATRVLLLAQGRIVLEGTPKEVEHHPLTRQIYLGTEQT